jgi:hypothetical protein
MAKRPSIPIPDLNDDELRQRLQPLADRVLPSAPAVPPARTVKPRRQGMEFALPEAVALELKTRAARRNTSATTVLLEILRDAGYPVVPADFVDLRKVPRKPG